MSQRYADPFPVVDMMIENEMLPEFIENLVEQVNEDWLWQLYLSVAMVTDKPFREWKAEVLQSPDKGQRVVDKKADRELTPAEAITRAEGILAGFHPF